MVSSFSVTSNSNFVLTNLDAHHAQETHSELPFSSTRKALRVDIISQPDITVVAPAFALLLEFPTCPNGTVTSPHLESAKASKLERNSRITLVCLFSH